MSGCKPAQAGAARFAAGKDNPKADAVPPPAPVKPAAPPLTPLGRRMKRSVARGKEAIDGRLDLHGYTQRRRMPRCCDFLRNAHARDARLVLVITGKGTRR